MTLIQRILALTAALLCANGVSAQDSYPVKPLTMMIPYPAGGPSDAIARNINHPLAKQLGQPVIVENLGGATGAIAAQRVLAAPADGYLLFQGSPNEVILSPMANAAVKFKPEDFRLVQMIGVSPIVLLARKDLPANTADELVALARNASKSMPLTYGSVGYGSFYHLLGEHLAQTIGATMTHVPYKGVAPLLQDMMGGHGADIAMLPYSRSYAALVEQGRLKILGTLSNTRPELLKHLPTVNEGKLLKDFSFTIWTGYMVKKTTSEAVVQRLNKAIAATLTDDTVRSKLEEQSLMVAQPLSPGEASKTYEAEIARYRTIAKAINLQPQ